jgi:hypothetical protein
MPTTPPPSPDDAAVEQAVPKSGKERALGAIGGVLAAGGGRESSPLADAMEKHHRQRIDLAQKHYKDFQLYTSILATGVDPDTGAPLKAEDAEKYYNLREAAGAELDKTAGVNKDVKGKLQRLRMLTDHIIKMHPKAGAQGGGGAGTGTQEADAGGGSRMTPPPSPTDSLKQNADADRLRQEVADQREFNQWKKQQETLKDYKIQETDAATKAKAANPNTRAVMGPAISVSNARLLAREGKSFNDIDGNPIDLTSLPDSMGLKNVIHGGKSYYEPFSPNSKVITVGNETYAVSPMDVEALGGGAGTDLGQHRTATGSTAVKGVNEGGLDVTQRTSTPTTPGVKSRTAPPPAPSGATKPTAGAGGGTGNLLPTPQNAGRIGPVREAMTQVLGDPTQPDFKALGDYMALADDSVVTKHVGAALERVLTGMEQEEKKAGSFITLLENYGGVPQALVKSQVSINKELIGSLTPKEAELFNASISALSTFIGMRSLTKASAAQASVKALERDLPLVGRNVFDSKAFRNKMGRAAESVYTGSRAIGGLTPLERKHIDESVKKWNAAPSANAKSRTTPPPKPSDGATHPLDDEIKKAVADAKKKAA